MFVLFDSHHRGIDDIDEVTCQKIYLTKGCCEAGTLTSRSMTDTAVISEKRRVMRHSKINSAKSSRSKFVRIYLDYSRLNSDT